ncbi:MAG: TatD family hydrolase [Oscillospiraceae bacterium]|nr:TatD family hydrolase [Oscillospiraceae bacterium]
MIDTHTHYLDAAFDPDREAVLAGDTIIIEQGIDITSSMKAAALARTHENVYAAVGIHPVNAERELPHVGEIERLAGGQRVAAIGEIGLDYRYEGRDVQREVFISQLRTAKEYSLPVCIHCVRAWGDMMSILREHRPAGVMHGFSGSAEILHEVLALGLYVGFNGSSTNPRNKKALAAIKEVPLDRLLLETDCPYSVPKGAASARCDSTLIGFTAEYISEIKGIPAETIINASDENAYKLFDLKEKGHD